MFFAFFATVKQGSHKDISDSKTLHFVQGAGMLNE
jgi:hypothetical protein